MLRAHSSALSFFFHFLSLFLRLSPRALFTSGDDPSDLTNISANECQDTRMPGLRVEGRHIALRLSREEDRFHEEGFSSDVSVKVTCQGIFKVVVVIVFL